MLSEVDSDFLLGLALDCDQQVRVFWFLSATGKSHVSGPGILWMMRSVNEQDVEVVLLRLQQQRDRGPCGGLDCGRGWLVVSEQPADVPNFGVYHATPSP